MDTFIYKGVNVHIEHETSSTYLGVEAIAGITWLTLKVLQGFHELRELRVTIMVKTEGLEENITTLKSGFRANLILNS